MDELINNAVRAYREWKNHVYGPPYSKHTPLWHSEKDRLAREVLKAMDRLEAGTQHLR